MKEINVIWPPIIIPHVDGSEKTIDISNGLVIVGANGSGKTKLLDMAFKEFYRADRNLKVSPKIKEFTHDEVSRIIEKKTEINLSDLDDLANTWVTFYNAEMRAYRGKKYKTLPNTLEQINRILKKIFSNFKLRVCNGRLMAVQSEGYYDSEYAISDMSGGERVILSILLKTFLCSPETDSNVYSSSTPSRNHIFVIDEPEIHLHKSLLVNFFDEIENEFKKACFVYVTHDTDFAASRTKAKKIWLKSYYCTQNANDQIINEAWDWEEIEENKDLPEKLLLELLGSRKPVLFVEGRYSSFDYQLYKVLFPDLLIKYVDGCEEVIKLTKAFLSEKQEGKTSAFHHINAFGLIDRDVRSINEIKSLKKNNVFVMSVAEIENLICVPELLEILWKDKCEKSQEKDWQGKLNDVQKLSLKKFNDDKDKQTSERVTSEIKHKIKFLKFEGDDDIEKLKKIHSDYQSCIQKKIDNIINSENSPEYQYKEILKFYNGKDLAEKIAQELGYDGKQELFEALIEYIEESEDNRKNVQDALKPYLNGLVKAIEGKPENK
jgi:energy-coupling factor transporter ATP-binding protein EcfA2